MDLISTKAETEDENQIVVRNESPEIVGTNTDDVSLEIKIEDESDPSEPNGEETYSALKYDSSFEVKIEIDELVGPKSSSSEGTCHKTSQVKGNERNSRE